MRRAPIADAVGADAVGADAAEPREDEAWAILLSVDGLGPAGFGALLLAHGSGRDILEAAGRPGAATTFARIASAAEGRTAFGVTVGEGIVAVATDPGPRLRIPSRIGRADRDAGRPEISRPSSCDLPAAAGPPGPR